MTRMRSTLAILLPALAVLAAGCGAFGLGGSHPQATAAITIQIRSGAKILRTETLGCRPPSGSAHPEAACTALRSYVRNIGGSPVVCHCPLIRADSRYALVTGTLDGKRVLARFGPCACGLRLVRDLRIVTGLRSFSPPGG
jgi:hypothetical protein